MGSIFYRFTPPSQPQGIICSTPQIPAECLRMCLRLLFRSQSPVSLLRSSVFHYEFEFIHPFADGNGRMGRLWQTALLASWKPVFEWIPVESIIKDRQEEYYRAIGLSTEEGKSDQFILFMLGAIKEAVAELARDTRGHRIHISNQIRALMAVIQTYPMSASELMGKLGLRSRATFAQNYIRPALEAGLIAMTDPDAPTSRNQRYYKI